MMWKSIMALGLALGFVLAASGAQAADSNSKSFIKSAIEGNYAEISVGKLAEQKGKTAAVKDYGKMLVADHTAANEKAIAAAKAIGVTPPTGSSVMEKATYLKLKVLSGDMFDRSFAKSMVSDHKNVIKEYQKESTTADAAGTYAKDALPTLQKHLAAAQKLDQQAQTTGSK